MKNHKELSTEIKYEKIKLHIKYLIGIGIGLAGVTIAVFGYVKDGFVSEVSFASTITSIILSVIAIIMTIVGETKSENTKDKLISLSENLENIVSRVENTTKGIENIVSDNIEVKDRLNNINNAIENKFEFVHKEAAIDTNITKKDLEVEFNCFKEVFRQAEQTTDYNLFKDMCITILFVAAKKIGNI